MSRSIKRRFSLRLGLLTNRGHRFGERRIHITKSQNESAAHIVLKVLAFIWFFDQEPVIEPKLDYRYRPDVAVFLPENSLSEDFECKSQPPINDLRVTEWIECKKTPPKKISRILHNLDCNFSLFHRVSALEGYRRALLRILRPSDLLRIRLYGVAGDLDTYFELLESIRTILALKRSDSITLYDSHNQKLGQVAIDTIYWKDDLNQHQNSLF
ncbi:MAG: hypothetical protein ACXACI_10495 [Candidatus Hodarchaeales archaeon]|jgi:hypothetical protein